MLIFSGLLLLIPIYGLGYYIFVFLKYKFDQTLMFLVVSTILSLTIYLSILILGADSDFYNVLLELSFIAGVISFIIAIIIVLQGNYSGKFNYYIIYIAGFNTLVMSAVGINLSSMILALLQGVTIILIVLLLLGYIIIQIKVIEYLDKYKEKDAYSKTEYKMIQGKLANVAVEGESKTKCRKEQSLTDRKKVAVAVKPESKIKYRKEQRLVDGKWTTVLVNNKNDKFTFQKDDSKQTSVMIKEESNKVEKLEQEFKQVDGKMQYIDVVKREETE